MRAALSPEPDLHLHQASPLSACAVFFLPSFFSFPALSGVYHADNWVLAIYHPFIYVNNDLFSSFVVPVPGMAVRGEKPQGPASFKSQIILFLMIIILEATRHITDNP
jgi:hypothetical protein